MNKNIFNNYDEDDAEDILEDELEEREEIDPDEPEELDFNHDYKY
jgi:hypothetical protein